MLDLVAWVATKGDFFLSSVAIYVILPRDMKPAQATLKAVLMFKSLSDFTGSTVILSKISFVIGKRVDLMLKKKVLSTLMI